MGMMLQVDLNKELLEFRPVSIDGTHDHHREESDDTILASSIELGSRHCSFDPVHMDNRSGGQAGEFKVKRSALGPMSYHHDMPR
ncbi:hypothetical protein PV327_006153 [Microctonus hyperodae]|uniref:Uncharacterized protein n=1 Tax=Microctonus hyperodae TaxID=165561 RepID=A0AA39G3P9_MICHY|nr:hypothetical protein PV327_006153 [Microctonus hyperodae]